MTTRAKARSNGPRKTKAQRTAVSATLDLATLDRTVWVLDGRGTHAEVMFIAPSPEYAKAFADGFNARSGSVGGWENNDGDFAEAGSEVLVKLLSNRDEHHDPERVRQNRLEKLGGAA